MSLQHHVISSSTTAPRTALHPKLTPSRTVVTSFTPRQRSSTPTAYNNNTNNSDPNTGSIQNVPTTPSSSAYEDGDWVLCLASSSLSNTAGNQQAAAATTISCALSNGSVQVYDQCSLLPIVSYLPHAVSTTNNNCLVTDMKYGPRDATTITSMSTILTTGNDGSFVMKDLRQPSDIMAQSINIGTLLRRSHSSHNNESLLSLALGYDGSIVALSSSKGHVHFIDLRMMTSGSHSSSNNNTASSQRLLLGSYVNSHRDAITQVEFHPERTTLLMSAGEDGLINIYDTTKSTEDLALETVINTGTPCRKAGFCNNNNNNHHLHHQYVYCLSGSETASIWDCHTAACINDFGNFSLRETLGTKTAAAMPIDYMVDAKWDPYKSVLLLCAGNHEGNTAIFTYDAQQHNSFWQVSECLMGGHRGIVRAWCPSVTTTSNQIHDDGSSSSSGSVRTIYFTAGEDARVCEWNCSTNTSLPLPLNSPDESMSDPETMDISTTTTTTTTNSNMATNRETTTMQRTGGPIRRQRRSSKTATKPY